MGTPSSHTPIFISTKRLGFRYNSSDKDVVTVGWLRGKLRRFGPLDYFSTYQEPL